VGIIQGDLIKPETYKHVIHDCDIIIHCAVDYTNYGQVDDIAVDTILSVCGESNNEQQAEKTKSVSYIHRELCVTQNNQIKS